jgi:hypothetical protein
VNKVQKPSDSERYTPSSELFGSIYHSAVQATVDYGPFSAYWTQLGYDALAHLLLSHMT